MSVLECDRAGCPNSMCDRLILNSSAYVCNDCYAELLAWKEQWPEEMDGGEVRRRIEAFMETAPGTHGRKLFRREIDDEFDALTGGT